MNATTLVNAFENELPIGSKGPVTAYLHRRNVVYYALLCVLAYLPTFLHLSAGWQAAGLGLLMPGVGFLAAGGWWSLLFPVTLAICWLAIVAWFWAGMVIAPLGVWLGAAALAGMATGAAIWPPALYLAPAGATAVFLTFQYRGLKRRQRDRESYKFRQTFFAESLAEVKQKAAVEPVPGERELDVDQIAAVRFVLERALQPIDGFKGFTIIDQFQPAALRYQINHMGFALGMVQAHYTPNFHGYLLEAQRNLIEKYRHPKVWKYWVAESMWGHFNFTRHDPVIRDNIMLSGWYGMHVGQYTLNTGDQRYGESGSLTFKLNDRKVYPHDLHTVVNAVAGNFAQNRFTLFPCEPNWVYPICNMYGLSALAAHDAAFGSKLAPQVYPLWVERLRAEFTDLKGSIVGLRSKWTGIEMPFYTGEAGFAFFANVFSRPFAQRLWAVGRKELGFCLAKDAEGKPRLTLPTELLPFLDKIDPGHYKPGVLFAYVAVIMCAREFGDDELAEATLRSLEQDCGRTMEDGVLSYRKGSCLANVWGVEARLMRTGDFRNTFVKGPPKTALAGPLLAAASYPDVLVAKAFSRGDDLELVLYNGKSAGPQNLGIERLKPGITYSVSGATVATITADASGRAPLTVRLDGRTTVRIEPTELH
jgi:Linalool dehydratase/isomerase